MYGDITLYNFYTNEYSYLPHNIQMSEYSTPSFRQNKTWKHFRKHVDQTLGICSPSGFPLFKALKRYDMATQSRPKWPE